MAVSESFRAYVLDQLERVTPVRWRAMFGGVGLYAGHLFFALIADDTLYFKVDDSNRSDFQAHGMGPFRSRGHRRFVMSYYEVPAEVLEDHQALTRWVRKALAAAGR